MASKAPKQQVGSKSRPKRRRSRRLHDQEQSLGNLPGLQRTLTGQNLNAGPQSRQEMVHQLQRQVGNRAIAPTLAPQAPLHIQRQDSAAIPGAGTPLVGLKRGDGLDFGTEETRSRVSLLQQKLNEKMMANIKVDGKFGPLTEEVLREFQESEGLLPQNIVDPASADLLMTEVEQPGGSPPGQPDVEYAAAGGHLADAANFLKSAGNNTFQAGNNLSTNEDLTVGTAGQRLINAGFLTIEASLELSIAAEFLKTGPGDSGVPEAGKHLQSASVALDKAGAKFTEAGAFLLPADNSSHSAAGTQIMSFGPGLIQVAQFLKLSGAKMAAYQAGSQRIGDPLVGLHRGDGLIVGSWHRRPRVKLLQQTLNDRAAAGLKVDGKFGPLTGKALMAYQTSAGISPYERVDRPTAQALRGSETGGQSSIPGAGEDLKSAGSTLNSYSNHLLLAGSNLSGSPDIKAKLSGQHLILSGSDFMSTGSSLISCGVMLSHGQPPAPGL